MKEGKKYCFYPKIQKVFGLISLIIIPSLVVLLVFYFHILLLIGTLLISTLIILLNIYFINNGVVIYEDKIIYYGIKKYEFKKLDIESIELFKGVYILIKNNGKDYRIPGYFDFLSKFPNSEKNKELILCLNKWLKKK